MRILTSILVLLAYSAHAQEPTWVQELTEERLQHEKDLRSGKVLNSQEMENLLELDYFPISADYFIHAKFQKKKGPQFSMATNTGRQTNYRRYGYLTFTLRDTLVKLTVYQNLDLVKIKEYQKHLFIPLRDGTSGLSTYGSGRFLDFQMTKGRSVKINLNRLYNPYCAYSERYSCPIPPDENHLKIYLNTGEKTPHLHEVH